MPDWRSILRDRLVPMRLEGTAESNLIDELAQHLEDRYRDLLSGGVADDEAYQQTISELANIYPLQAELKSAQVPSHELLPVDDPRPLHFASDLWRDLRYALRTIRKNPVFVLFVVVTLALGIGANTTVFTVINTLILNPLPIPDSSHLQSVGMIKAEKTPKPGLPLPLSFADLRDYQTKNQVFQSLAGYTSVRVLTWQNGSASQRVFGELVTGNYFSTLGLTPAKGRFFLPNEDGSPGAHPVAVMSYGTWQSRFGGVSDIVGKTFNVNNVALTVVGVGPPQFIGINGIFGPDLWIPAAMAEQLLPNEMSSALSDRGKGLFLGVGRLRPGISQEQAQANFTAIAANLAREYPAADDGRKATVGLVRDILFASAGTSSMSLVFASAGLLIVVGIVLLIACSNVANLLLARSAARQQEIAVRLAMGASRTRLIRQLLTESVLLGMLGGLVGMLIGYWGLRALFGALPSAANFIAPKMDPVVFVFAFVVSLATGFLFGIIPAFSASRASVAETLKEESRTTGKSRRRISVANVLLVGQVAFSFLLLALAALFLRSIQRAYELDPGFQTEHLAIFMTNPGQTGYNQARTLAFYQSARDRVATLPGVASVSWASNLPLWARPLSGLQIEGRQQKSQADKLTSIVDTVDLDYFDTAGVTIKQGRVFTNIDQESTIPVAVVNEKLARDYWPGGDAIGKRLQLPGELRMRLIIGIAKNANYTNWAEPPQNCVYVPLAQEYSDAMVLFVRSKGAPQQIIADVQREARAAGPGVMVSDTRTGRTIIDGGLFGPRIGVALLSVFGMLALGLASIGLYGIMAYSVSQRKREIGLRMALGAARTAVLGLVLKQGMQLVLMGVLIGLASALIVGQLLKKMLFGVAGSDPLSLVSAAVVLLAVAFLACYLPARWASRVDPLVALREG